MTAQVARSHTRIATMVLCGLLVIAFTAAGVVKLIPMEFERHGFTHFGYPLWFMTLIGLVEIAGALMMVFSATRAAGALLNAAVMVGAVCSHLRAGDGVGMATPAFVLLLLLLLVALVNRGPLREAVEARLVSRSA